MSTTVRTTAGSVEMVCRVHSVGDVFGLEIGIPCEAAEGVEIGEGERRAEPAVLADAGDSDHSAELADGTIVRR